jgi:phytoene dehydrogenase-like protein
MQYVHCFILFYISHYFSRALSDCSWLDAMIEDASRLIPGLKESIEFKDAATPLTYERYTHNTAGASSAWSWNPKKEFYKNAMSVNIKTPVKNLFIGSCWAMQIGGVPGALAAAYLCTRKIR